MPAPATEKIAPRLSKLRAQMATSFPDMHWKDIHAKLEKQREGIEYLGKPGTTQKEVAKARKLIKDNPEEKVWRIDMVEGEFPVSADALADVMSAWRWHTVGQGIPFTVRMAKWVSRLRLMVGTDGQKKTLAKYMELPANDLFKDEIRDGLLATQSLRLCAEAVAIASEELACIALGREFNPTSLMIDIAWGHLDGNADPKTFGLRTKARKQMWDFIDRTGAYELTGYGAATTAQSYGWHADDEDWSASIRLHPLDELAAHVINTVANESVWTPRREVVELVIGVARNSYAGIDAWKKQAEPEKHEFVKQTLFKIKTGRNIENGK
jgi:hypothetical protein